MNLSRQRQGELIIFVEVTLWSLFPIITVLSYKNISPLFSLTISSFLAACFFAVFITKRKLWSEVTNRAAFKNILFATLFLGIGYYLLIFLGLQYTTPGNASIIGLTQGFFSFLFFHVLRKEYIPKAHIWGGFFMVCGALIILASNFHTFKFGDFLILLANAISPFGNFYAQKARKQVSSETIMFVRSSISATVIFLLAITLKSPISLQAVQGSLWFLLINGFILLGLSKILWIEGIHRISVTKALGLGSIEPLFTLTFAYLLLQQIPTVWQLVSIFPIIIGIFLLSKQGIKQQITPVED